MKTLVEVIEPYHGRVYDPCCGSGGMFVQSADFVKRHQGNINDISVYGQESNPTTWKMATMNLAIRGIDADLGGRNKDTFSEDLHEDKKFDFILANPHLIRRNGVEENIGMIHAGIMALRQKATPTSRGSST